MVKKYRYRIKFGRDNILYRNKNGSFFRVSILSTLPTRLSLDAIRVPGSVFYFAFLPTLTAGIFCNANPNLRWAIRGRRFFFILKLCAHVWGAYLFCNMNQKRVGQNKRQPFLLIPGGFAGFRKRFWEDFCCRCPSSKFRNWYLKRNSYADFSARRFRFFIFSIFFHRRAHRSLWRFYILDLRTASKADQSRFRRKIVKETV